MLLLLQEQTKPGTGNIHGAAHIVSVRCLWRKNVYTKTRSEATKNNISVLCKTDFHLSHCIHHLLFGQEAETALLTALKEITYFKELAMSLFVFDKPN